MHNCDFVIIGAGIVGLATSFKLQKLYPNKKIIIIEKESEIAAHQTSHNSGVIHSGIYYKPGSLKARNCVDGYNQLIHFCQKYSVPFELCGKIIAATHEKEIPILKEIFKRGQENGLLNMTFISKEEAREIEPHLQCVKGIKVPQTGIINYKSVCKKIAELVQLSGAEILLNTAFRSLNKDNMGLTVQTSQSEIRAKYLINCGGLYSDKIAKTMNPDLRLKIVPFRGEYYNLKKEKEYLVKNLIYPVPDPDFPFLGVHFTRMIDGGVEAGPNAVLALKREGYKWTDFSLRETLETLTFSGFYKFSFKYWKAGFSEIHRSLSKKQFTRSLQKLVPEILEKDLEPGGSGVRAQACDYNGKLIDDFFIIQNKLATHVCNAPSPAATSSLAIADYVVESIRKKFLF